RSHHQRCRITCGRAKTLPDDETKGRNMWDYVKLVALGVIALLAAIAANYARDEAYLVNALTVMLAAAATFIWTLRNTGEPKAVAPKNEYFDGVVRAGVIATAFWGVVGFLVGVVVAAQLAFPVLNF